MNSKWKKEQQDTLAEECISYFRKYKVFDRLLHGFRQKYSSYGCFSGSVVVRISMPEDIEVLEGFLQRSYHGKKSVTVSARRFEQALADSRFSSFTPKEVLELYFREEMTGKKEHQKEEEKNWIELFLQLQEQYKETDAGNWIAEASNKKGEVYPLLQKLYKESNEEMTDVKKFLTLGAEIVNVLPCRNGRSEYLAVFAAAVTGNPHAFDDGTRAGILLKKIVEWNAERQGIQVAQSQIFPALRKQKLYLSAGIMRDDISNYAMLCGVQVWKKDDTLHMGMEGFRKDGVSVQVSLSDIMQWSRVECPDNKIYIVENPSVYAILCGKWKGTRACLCMNGQPRLSSVIILDLLAKTGVTVYYAGDFDPEGLLIAQKVKQYYKGECHFWHVSGMAYEKSMSEEIISERRMKILEHITEVELVPIVHSIRETRRAGYQENIWEMYLKA